MKLCDCFCRGRSYLLIAAEALLIVQKETLCQAQKLLLIQQLNNQYATPPIDRNAQPRPRRHPRVRGIKC